jgi:cysteinyl-tRNA synthetase
MSKSLGNFITIKDALAKTTPEVLRFVLLSTHYRMPLDFSMQRVEEAEKGLTRIYETLARVDEALNVAPQAPRPQTEKSELLTRFREAMDDDCNTAQALGVVFETIRDMNRSLDTGQTTGLAAIRADLATIVSVLGVVNEVPTQFLEAQKQRGLAQSQLTPERIEELITERAAARKAKDFKRSDAIRNQLAEQGVTLKDSPTGTTWTMESGRKA